LEFSLVFFVSNFCQQQIAETAENIKWENWILFLSFLMIRIVVEIYKFSQTITSFFLVSFFLFIGESE
jgi:hypothetical protein